PTPQDCNALAVSAPSVKISVDTPTVQEAKPQLVQIAPHDAGPPSTQLISQQRQSPISSRVWELGNPMNGTESDSCALDCQCVCHHQTLIERRCLNGLLGS